MGLLDQRYIMGIFFPHVLSPWSQFLAKLRRLLFLMSFVIVFGGLLAYSYIFYSPCDGTTYVTPAGTEDLHGFIFLAYIVLGGWGMEFYRTALDEAAWVFVWDHLSVKPRETAEILASIKATVFGGDPELGFFKFIASFAKLPWQDRVLEMGRYFGMASIFTGLVLLNLVRDTNIVNTSLLCTFYFGYWLSACLLFGVALFPIFLACILQFFVLVPPLSPHAAAVSLENILQSLGPTGSTVADSEYLTRAKMCRCRWRVVKRRVRGYSYPLLEWTGIGQGCPCNIRGFNPQTLHAIFRKSSAHHWLYMLLATGIAVSIIGAYFTCKQEVDGLFLYGVKGQAWTTAAILLVNHFVCLIIKDIARNRFMCLWINDGLSAGYIAISSRVWGSGAEWVWTALLFQEHRRFGKFAVLAYMSVWWVMLASLWMIFDGLFTSARQGYNVVYGTLILGFILSSAGFYYLKRDFNHPTCVLQPQPLRVIRWVREGINLQERDVPITRLGRIGQRLSAGSNTSRLVPGQFT